MRETENLMNPDERFDELLEKMGREALSEQEIGELTAMLDCPEKRASLTLYWLIAGNLGETLAGEAVAVATADALPTPAKPILTVFYEHALWGVAASFILMALALWFARADADIDGDPETLTRSMLSALITSP